MRDFRQLKVWQLAHQLALDLYKASGSFPRTEMYGLTSQIRRAAVSIGANVSEGSARHSDAVMRQFLAIAHGSATETQYLLLLARDLGYLSVADYDHLSGRAIAISRMLYRFVQRLTPAGARPSRRR